MLYGAVRAGSMIPPFGRYPTFAAVFPQKRASLA